MVKKKAMEQRIANTCQTLNFELFTVTLTCLIHANDKPRSDKTDGYTEVSFLLRASRTTEMVTVRQFISNCEMEISSFFGPKLIRVDFSLMAICYCLYVMSLGSGRLNIPMAMAIDDANFGRLLVGSLFFNSLTYNQFNI